MSAQPPGGSMSTKRPRTDAASGDGDWTCPACGNVNFSFRTSCNMRKCGAPKPAPGPSLMQPLPQYAHAPSGATAPMSGDAGAPMHAMHAMPPMQPLGAPYMPAMPPAHYAPYPPMPSPAPMYGGPAMPPPYDPSAHLAPPYMPQAMPHMPMPPGPLPRPCRPLSICTPLLLRLCPRSRRVCRQQHRRAVGSAVSAATSTTPSARTATAATAAAHGPHTAPLLLPAQEGETLLPPPLQVLNRSNGGSIRQSEDSQTMVTRCYLAISHLESCCAVTRSHGMAPRASGNAILSWPCT
ncbi:unnamed protein product [Closterium sp. Yama58-4]|nr:unnamed protein product [Closterium sp. Yama58-4]